MRRQHLIDPETCIRCNTCEETCPVDAITHDGRNYVVDPGEVRAAACIAPCPTGAIDNWRRSPLRRLTPSRSNSVGRAPHREALGPCVSARPHISAGPMLVTAASAPQASPEAAASPVAPLVGLAPGGEPLHPSRACSATVSATTASRAPAARAIRTTSSSTSVAPLFPRSRDSRSESCPQGPTTWEGRTTRASTHSRARATASAPATTMSRSPSSASRPITGAFGSWRLLELPV